MYDIQVVILSFKGQVCLLSCQLLPVLFHIRLIEGKIQLIQTRGLRVFLFLSKLLELKNCSMRYLARGLLKLYLMPLLIIYL